MLLGIVIVLLTAAGPALGSDKDTALTLVQHSGHWNPRPDGLRHLAWEIRQRTSIAIDLDVQNIRPSSDQLYDHPLLFWQGDSRFDPFSETIVRRLRHHLHVGGTWIVDLSDGRVGGAFHRSMQHLMQSVLPHAAPQPVPKDHVLYKSFYLIDGPGGRLASRDYLEAYMLHDRLAVIIIANDLAGALAKDGFGQWTFPVDGGPRLREQSTRLGVNLLMYALCLDYKEDHVHLPFILKRRR